MAGVPPWATALVAAGALAAALSTAAGLLLVIAAGVAHDLVRGVAAPRISDRAELGWARAAAAVAAIGAGLLAFHPPAAIAETVAIAFGLAAGSFFPALVLGIFWKRTTREGAVVGMIVGLVVTAAYAILYKHVRPDLDVPARWWLGVSPEGFGAIGALANAVVTTVVSLATRAPPAEVQGLVDALRYPREAEPGNVAAAVPRDR
jgi:cation/acetate symporter